MFTKIEVGPDLKMFQILFATYTQQMVLLSQSERNFFLSAVLIYYTIQFYCMHKRIYIYVYNSYAKIMYDR